MKRISKMKFKKLNLKLVRKKCNAVCINLVQWLLQFNFKWLSWLELISESLTSRIGGGANRPLGLATQDMSRLISPQNHDAGCGPRLPMEEHWAMTCQLDGELPLLVGISTCWASSAPSFVWPHWFTSMPLWDPGTEATKNKLV